MLGKAKLLVIGGYPAISLSSARQARDVARADLANGADPNDVKQHKALMEGKARARTFERLPKSTWPGSCPRTVPPRRWKGTFGFPWAR